MKLLYMVEVEVSGRAVDPIEIQDHIAEAIERQKANEGLTGESGDYVTSVNVSFDKAVF